MEEKKPLETVKAGDTTVSMDDSPIVEEMRKRIWASTNPMNVVQLRNSITDMFILKFLTVGEYIALNGEIDRFVNYSITYGVR